MTTESIQTLRTKARDAVVQALGDAYDCERSWSAWGWGTMGEEDFTLVAKNPDRVTEITDAVLDALGVQDLIKERDRLREAVIETARVIESDDPAITDTLFTTDRMTTLYECCLDALGIEDSEDVTEGRNPPCEGPSCDEHLPARARSRQTALDCRVALSHHQILSVLVRL